MKTIVRNIVVLFAFFLLIPVAYALPPTTASQVPLKVDCGGDPNCFSDPASLLGWIWDIRRPTVASPLVVDIGAGTFIMPLRSFCQNAGYVTFRGAGRDNTVLTGGGLSPTGDGAPVLSISNCINLSFQDMTIRADSIRNGAGASDSGIDWGGAGSSTWTNVAVEASYYGWLDYPASCANTGTHYWAGSKIQASAGPYSIAYLSSCGTSWIYGSEVVALADGGIAGTQGLVGVRADSLSGRVEIYGSAVRAIATPNNTNGTISIALAGHTGLLTLGGTIHMHGGIISVRAENANNANRNVTGVRANGGFIHTPDTAFGLRASGPLGQARRVSVQGGGTVEAPFTWPAGNTPPTSSPGGLAIRSVNGQDMFVQTNCAVTGCQANGTETHLLIYNDNCVGVGGPWFDVVTRACR